MAIVLNGTSGAQIPLGTAAAPSATNTTAQATGLYFPSSTTLGLSTNGTAALTIDASQNVGIGTTGPAGKVDSVSNAYAAFVARSSSSGAGTSVVSLRSTDSGAANFANAQYDALTHQWQIAGTERMRIDSSGNVGVGTTSPSASLSVVKQTTALSGTGNSYGLYMYPTSSGLTYIDAITSSTGNTSLGFRTYNNGTYNEMRMDSSGNVGIGTSSPITRFQVGGGGGGAGWAWFNQNVAGGTPQASMNTGLALGGNYSAGGSEGNIVYGTYLTLAKWNGTTYSESMRIDSSGNVGIGTSSPGQKLTVYSASGDNRIRMQSAASVNTGIEMISTSGTGYFDYNSQNFIFNTNGADRMRVYSDGRVLYNTTQNTYNNGQFGSGYGTSYWTFGPQAGTSSFLVQNGATSVGVYLVGGNTSWTGTSDGRLKNIVGTIENGLTKVLSMNPVKYTWKESEDDREHLGFIAQEMEQIEPTVVSTESNGNMGITYTEIIPVLVKAIQELKAELDALKGAQ